MIWQYPTSTTIVTHKRDCGLGPCAQATSTSRKRCIAIVEAKWCLHQRTETGSTFGITCKSVYGRAHSFLLVGVARVLARWSSVLTALAPAPDKEKRWEPPPAANHRRSQRGQSSHVGSHSSMGRQAESSSSSVGSVFSFISNEQSAAITSLDETPFKMIQAVGVREERLVFVIITFFCPCCVFAEFPLHLYLTFRCIYRSCVARLVCCFARRQFDAV